MDHRADIYSLGVVFYQMLTGELPIGRFAPPSQKVQIDVRLDEVVLRALEKEPELRFQQASQVKSEVETILQSPTQRQQSRAAGSSAAADDILEPARLQVQGPAIGLLVTGILNWLTVPLIVVLMAYMTAAFSGPAVVSPDVFVPVLIALLASLLFSSFVIFAALRMKRLEAYGLAIAASILAILVSPNNLIGLPIGIWSLVVLSRADVQAAFARRQRETAPRRPASRSERRLGFAALVISVAAFPLAALGGTAGNAAMSFVLLQVTALICGIAGRRSVAGKLAICFFMILVLGTTVIGLSRLALRHDVRVMPSVKRPVTATSPGNPAGTTAAGEGTSDDDPLSSLNGAGYSTPLPPVNVNQAALAR